MTSFSKILKKTETKELYNLYQRGMMDPSFPRTALGIIYESLLSKILNDDSVVCASMDFGKIPYIIREHINFNDHSSSFPPVSSKKKNLLNQLLLNTFYYQESRDQWDFIDYLKIVETSTGSKLLIGIQATVGHKHRTSMRGVNTINSLMSINGVSHYYHIYFVPDTNYFTLPNNALNNIESNSSSTYVCKVSIELKSNTNSSLSSVSFPSISIPSTPINQKKIIDTTTYTPTTYTPTIYTPIRTAFFKTFQWDQDIYDIWAGTDDELYDDIGSYYRVFRIPKCFSFDIKK
jgi:hypothetical protein